MQIKGLEIKDIDEKGKGQLLLARLSEVDKDDDTYMAGAFSWKQGGGQWTQMIPAHDRRAMPFGKSWLYEKEDQAQADFTLNLETQAGKDWHAALKFDLETGQPVQQWSYGFDVLDFDQRSQGGKTVRVLKRLDVYEISPVLRGAGVGTGTLGIKSAELKGAQFEPLIASLAELAGAVKADPAILSATGLKQLSDIYAALGIAISPDDQEAAIKTAEQLLEHAHAAMVKRSLGRHLPA
jgi:hypothetical protein